MTEPRLIRTLALTPKPSYGKDVEAVRRAAIRYLDDNDAWRSYQRATTIQNRTYGPGAAGLVARVEKKAGLAVDRKAGAAVNRVLRRTGAYDSVCDDLLDDYSREHPPKPEAAYVYPHPAGSGSTVCQGLHATAGITNNWAVDFCAHGGTPVLAVVACEIVKLSGHPPTYVLDPSLGIFGWNVYYESVGGYRWFSTHYGKVNVRVGQMIKRGQIIGYVGHWPGNEGRSHTHLGVTSERLGPADAKRVITTVSTSPKIPAV